MTLPSSVSVECPICKHEALHEVLTGKVGGKAQTVFETTVKCKQCGHVHHAVLTVQKPVDIPVVVSWLRESVKSTIALDPDEVLSVEDEVMCGEDPVLITSIESKGARVKCARAGDIQTIWGKKFDKVRVPFSINHHGRSYSDHVMALPDEEFFIGDMMKVGKHEIVIHSIKIKERSLRIGGACARDIVRVYANIVRKSTSH
jgi:uncharacterized Zn finger protein